MLLAAALLLCRPGAAGAQQDAATPAAATAGAQQAIAATKQAPPFVMRDPNGTWRGLAVDLWQAVAAEAGIDYAFQEVTIPELLDGVADQRFLIGVAPLTITRVREEKVDFSNPFYTTGWSIAVPHQKERPIILQVLEGLFSVAFLLAVLGLRAAHTNRKMKMTIRAWSCAVCAAANMSMVVLIAFISGKVAAKMR